MTRTFLLLTACTLLAACGPKPIEAVEATPIKSEQSLEGIGEGIRQNYIDAANGPSVAQLDKMMHAVIEGAPRDFAMKPCVYVASWNTPAWYDQAREFSNGSAYDGGAFPMLGETDDGLIKVAGPNYRKNELYAEDYPLAKDEPDTVVLYFRKETVSRDPKKTAWVASGMETPTGDCQA